MISADIILDKRYKSKKGYPVKIRVYDSILAKKKEKERDYISLSLYQNSNTLNMSLELKKRELDLAEQIKYCNDNFLSLNEAVDIIKNGIPTNDIDIEIQVLEKKLELLKKKQGQSKEIGLIEFIDVLTKEKKILKKITISNNVLKSRVLNFINPQTDISLNSINREWLTEFDLFYKQKGLADSSIFSYINMVRAIYKEAQLRESLNVKKDNPFLKLRTFHKNKKTTELTIQDLISIKNLDVDSIITKSQLGKEGVKRIADILLFQFCIGGHDIIDIANLKWSNIENDRIKFKRYKNRNKSSQGEEVNNKLNSFCRSVIEKYGDQNSERVFTFLSGPETDEYRSQISRFIHNIYPAISRSINSKNYFTSKSTRYLFRTVAGNLLIDSYVIMKLQGHTPQGVTFGYQGALNQEVQDREHKKILDLIFK